MYLFKTSGATFDSVIENQKHAFRGKPRDWHRGEIVLVSKNKKDLRLGEKQIQYRMRLENIRELRPGESERYWPGTEGRWRYLVECTDTERLGRAFDLEDVLGPDAQGYKSVMTFKKFEPEHAQAIERRIG